MQRDPGELPCAVGGELTAAGLLRALRSGWIVIPSAGQIWLRAAEFRFGAKVADGTIDSYPPGCPRSYAYTWWNPSDRFVLPVDEANFRPNQRRIIRDVNWNTTVNRAFDDVVEECRSHREPRWITDEYATVLTALWRDGFAYSHEVWESGQLVGGGFGFITGAVVTVESNFTRRNGAGKLVVIDLARRAAESGFSLVDLQWPTQHGREVGGRLVPGETLRTALAADRTLGLPADERPAAWWQQGDCRPAGPAGRPNGLEGH
jgi:leucyl/phenylalanyl-tRNA--protein transferase